MCDGSERLRWADEALDVVAAQRGDHAAFSRLIERYDRRLFYFVRRQVGKTDEAQDIIQSAWLTAYRQLPRLKTPQAFRVWLYRIVYTTTANFLRQLATAQSLQMLPEEPGVDDDSDNFRFDNVELIHTGLEQLTVEHRQVLVLRFLEDMSEEDMANILGCAPGTVKSRLHYARLALRRWMKETGHA